LDSLGQQALAQLDRVVLTPTTLALARQAQIRAEYDQWIQGTPSRHIVFRHGGPIGANAFALPDGTIVVTDEIIAISKNDLEIMAVLAHETGHLLRRHALRQAITGASLSVLVIAVTGDSSDLLSSIPSALIGMSYSRGFEREADEYAYQIMQQHKIPLHYFSDILTRMESEDAKKSKPSKTDLGKNNIGDYISTHPPTAERIARFQGGR
jgi:Zn-dependent protease with chaperone function